ncbi:MAG: glycosyltransferase family 4 protein [Phycisphaerales bacterium JB060]
MTAQPAHPCSSSSASGKAAHRPRRVLLGPVFTDNPYTDRLIEALQRQGFDVRPLEDPRAFDGAARWLEAGDVLHLQWAHVFTVGRHALGSIRGTARLLWRIKRLRSRGVRVVWTVHNLVHHEACEGSGGRTQRWAMRRLARACDALVVHGAAGAQLVRETYRIPDATIAVVDHPSFIGSYPAVIPQDDARHRLGLPHDAVVLAHIGQLRRYKGVMRLVEAFAAIERSGAYLIVAGKAGDTATIDMLRKAAANDNQIRLFEGFVPDDEIQIYMAAADAVVLPYERVFTSGSVALAGTFGRAVIAPAVGCLPDQVGETGLLYEPAQAGAIETALTRACGDRASLLAMGMEAQQLAMTRTWDALARGVASIYYNHSGR